MRTWHVIFNFPVHQMLLSIWGSVFDRFWIPKSINIQFSYSTGSQNSLLCWPLNCQDLSSTKHLDVLRRFTTSLSSPLCSTWTGNVIRLSFLPPPLASSVYICNPEAPGVICVRCQVHGQEQGNNQDQEGGDQTAERASDAPPTATGEVWLVHWYPIIQPRSAELARQPQSFFTQTAPFSSSALSTLLLRLPPSISATSLFFSQVSELRLRSQEVSSSRCPPVCHGVCFQQTSVYLPSGRYWHISTPWWNNRTTTATTKASFTKKKPEVCVRFVQRRWRWTSWRLDGAKNKWDKTW